MVISCVGLVAVGRVLGLGARTAPAAPSAAAPSRRRGFYGVAVRRATLRVIRAVAVVHVGLLDAHEDLVADLEWQRTLLDLRPGSAVDHLERVEGQSIAALEVEVLARVLLEL